MTAWAVGVAVVLAVKWIDWITAIFFEVPLVLVGRVIWDTIKVGKDGVELSVSRVVTDAAARIDLSVESIASRDRDESAAKQAATAEAPEVQPKPADLVDEKSNPATPKDPFVASVANALEIARTSRVSLTVDDDRSPLLIMAQLRIDIEQELRRMAFLAGLVRPGQNLGAGVFLRLLRSNELLPDDIADALDQVIKIANAALHGDQRVADSEYPALRSAANRMLEGLNELTQTETWIANAVYVRAKKAGLTVEREYRFGQAQADLYVGELPIVVARPVRGPLIAPSDGLLVVAGETTMFDVERYNSSAAVAWIVDGAFIGTARAVAIAPWLVGNP
jgi:hypothetical protein